MSAIDKQLIGSNFCDLDCIDNNNPIHPESCTDVIKVSHDSEVSLAEWFKNEANGGFGDYTSMKKWLEDNYNISSDYSLPIASVETLGGIKLNDTYFDIDNTGVFSLKDVSMTFIPNADYSNYINAGSLSNVFSDSTVNISIPPFTTELELSSSELSAKSYIDNVLYNTSKILIDDLASFIADNNNLKNSFNNRWQISITDNIIKLTDSVAQTYTQATLPYTNYTAGENINIVNGAISATDTTYEAFTGTNAGLVPTSTTEDTDKYLRSDGTWADPKYNSTKLWTSSGLSDHYFRITSGMVDSPSSSTPSYIPLFTINMYLSESSMYKASHLFEITSRLDHQYYGKFLLTYYKIITAEGDPVKGILTITNTDSTSLNIVAYYDDEEKKIRVYRKYTASSFPDTFIVSILGQNNPFYTPIQCDYVYYHTDGNKEEDDTVIDNSETPIGTQI